MRNEQWEIAGKIQVLDTMTANDGTAVNKPLAGVTVEVYASSFLGKYKSWGRTYTDAKGNFSLCQTKNKDKRDFKVYVRLRDKTGMVTINTPLLGGGVTEDDWYKVYQTTSKVRAGTLNVGTRVFSTSSSGELGKPDNVTRAHMFYWVKTVMDGLKRRGGGIEFTKPVIIAYPANVITGASYANGVTRTAYIHRNKLRDHGNVDTVLHEIMHLWDYEHNTGTSNWLQAASSGNNTHEFQEKAAIAFHEGFAEWGKDALMTEFFGRRAVLPASRFSLAERGLNSFESLERNDDGVTHALHLLITPEIWAYRFGDSTHEIGRLSTGGAGSFKAAIKGSAPEKMPNTPSVTVFDVLRVFLAKQHPNWPTRWQVGTMDNGLNVFLQRASDILQNLTPRDRTMIVEMLTSSLTTEPADFLPSAQKTSRKTSRQKASTKTPSSRPRISL